MLDRHTLANGHLRATVKAEGAELCSLADAADRELLWQAGPTWPRHAPVLFPIVGELAGGTMRSKGHLYRMGRHGFARDRRFAWLSRDPTVCRLVLHDDAATRAHYPFAFRLELSYALADDALEVTYVIANPGREVLPASVGAHPAFQWPLLAGAAKEAHQLEFEIPEPAPIRRLQDGLIKPDPMPTPIAGRMLRLDPALFDADAVILDQPASRSVRYTAPGAPCVEVGWEGFRQLGIWSRRDADLLCIEPWHGMADPVGFDGDFADKPGLLTIPPGERRELLYRIRVF